jgi:tetratricopeptide (TPR) repeat protein
MKKFEIRTGLTLIALAISGLIANGQDLQSAKSLTRSERFEEAENAYKSVLQKEPNNSEAYFYYGQSTIKQYLADTFSVSKGEALKNASDLFKKGLAADTNNALNIVGLGMIELLNNGDTTKADKFFLKANGKVPAKVAKCIDKDIKVLITLGSAQVLGKNKRYTKGLVYLEKAKEATTDKKTGLGKNADVFLAIGDVYLSNKMHNEAIKNYNTALGIDPKYVEAQLRIGYLYMGAKNLNGARQAFIDAKNVDSTFAPVYRGLGEVYTIARQYKFAKDNFRTFLKLSGDNTAAKASYAASLFKSGEYDEAIKTIEEVLAVDNSRNYLNRIAAFSCFEKKPQDLEKGLKFSEAFFAKATPEKIIPKDYAYLGRIELKMKKDSITTDQGVSNLIKAYEQDTTDLDILNEAYKQSYYNKKYDKAAMLLTKKIAKGNADITDYMMLGKTYYQIKQYNKADSVFSVVAAKDPKNVDAYVWMANTAASIDPDSKAGLAKPKYELVIQAALSDTAKNKNELMNAYSYLASYYLKIKKDNEQTKNYAQKIINLDPNNKDFKIKGYSFLSAVFIANKDYNKVKQVYNKLLEIDPTNADYKKMIEWANAGIESQKKKQ